MPISHDLPRTTGTRTELVRMLREMAEGWWHLAKDELAEAARDGAERLEAGASSIRVGHTIYTVTDG